MNSVTLLGNLSRDPELRTTNGGKTVCSFGLAVNRRRKVEGQPDADFFNVSTWGVLAENCHKYLSKGRKVCVSGEIQVRNYEDRDGVKRTAVDIQASQVEFVGGGKADEAQTKNSATPSPEFTQVDDEELPF